ncbi:putative LRR receptor-like serine/threonine-protein kinase [Dendrobium catenatum]|uniref:non-specific serine/threonine protein kinase n=2 Tax=Dendrobium catenatum TaxID=906689 RepID=A0A2I0VJV4_9ASPA|nr:putative LRR receptor-like serine/threonine-protein kinase [Dendrobium catenatum]
MSSDGTSYDKDNATLTTASYYVTNPIKWAVSNTGSFAGASNPNTNYIISSQTLSANTLDQELFQTARMSPSSLRYYGLGLENGNYTVKLQFSEIGLIDPPTWKSLGRRVFDIYLQEKLIEKDFDIRKEAGGKSFTAVVKEYRTPVTNNFLEIHFFWAGKGTSFIPSQGYYGPSICAISVSPAFIPSVSNKAPNSSSSSNKTGLIVGIIAGVVLGLVIFAILVWRQKKKNVNKDEEELLGMAVRPNTFSYSELRAATEDFNQSNLLGEGGFGPVYKGKLYDGRMVAVKQLLVASHHGKSQFMAEIAIISAVQQRYLVKLYGCCIEGDKRLLVYEYLENKSLDKAIFGKNVLLLNWRMRFEICLGTARGLAYLHEESSVKIVHRDVKSSNILLDRNLNPKISDFGLAKLYDDKKTHISTRVAGTIGYLAPEYAMRGHLTEKADVFGFGVVALEVLSGRPNSDSTLEEDKVYLLDWAWRLYEQKHELDLVDPILPSYNRDEAIRVFGVALLCIQASPALRPPMSRVVAMLAGDVEVNEVTSRPSYLTEWQFNDISSNFANDDCSRSTSLSTALTNIQTSEPSDPSSTVTYMGIDPSADVPLRHNSIREGR